MGSTWAVHDNTWQDGKRERLGDDIDSLGDFDNLTKQLAGN
jgi:hypothetical protein